MEGLQDDVAPIAARDVGDRQRIGAATKVVGGGHRGPSLLRVRSSRTHHRLTLCAIARDFGTVASFSPIDRLRPRVERIVVEWAQAIEVPLRRVGLPPLQKLSPSAVAARCTFSGRGAEGNLLFVSDTEVLTRIDHAPSSRSGERVSFGEKLKARDLATEAAQQLVGRLGAMLSPHDIRIRPTPARALSDPEIFQALRDAREIEHTFASGAHYLAVRLGVTFAFDARITERDRPTTAQAPGSLVLFDDQ